MPQRFPILFVTDRTTVSGYKKPGGNGGGSIDLPPRSPQVHGTRLKAQLNEVFKEFDAEQLERMQSGEEVTLGKKVTFNSSPRFILSLNSLEALNQKILIRLLTVREVLLPNVELPYLQATVFIPNGQEGYFLKKIQKYLESEDGKANRALIDSIDSIQRTLLEHLWQEQEKALPGAIAEWCECWVRLDYNQGKTKARKELEKICDRYGIELSTEELIFPERAVYLLKAHRKQLNELLVSYDYLAELRKAREPVNFWMKEPAEQGEYAELLRERVEIEDDANVRVLVLDTGVNNGHQLLADLLHDEDCHTYQSEWGTSDSDGHGTFMAGLAVYGDLHEALQHNNKVWIPYRLESGKILPPTGSNPRLLYGHITGQLISEAEIKNVDAKRIICMAVTTDGDTRGQPTSWSGKVDALVSGYGEEDRKRRLFLISAGNVPNNQTWRNYPEVTVSQTQDPAQAWNALVVGAYTERALIQDPNFSHYTVIAPARGLSPFSCTSIVWGKDWPQKPDIVMEGGNAGWDKVMNYVEPVDELSILSLSHEIKERQFDVDIGTSPATAKAAHLCALIQAEYAHAWPETIRGLMVHSARWTDAMEEHFLDGNNKTSYENLIRCCGYGVPNAEKALYCSENMLTLIAQEEIQPYQQEGKGNVKPRDIHYFDFPWPEQILNNLGDTEVTMRITLSYFVEPNPSDTGWKDRYKYASHGLRFDVNKFTEKKDTFRKRINKAARDEGEQVEGGGDPNRWLIGEQARHRGSIHTDEITATAVQLAACKNLAVYPVAGWWKYRKHLQLGNSKTRYALIVTLETPPIDIDIYTEVANQIKTTIKVL